MEFHLNGNYKSLNPFSRPVNLPDFVILTGINGAGKSQFLYAISKEIITTIDNLNPKILVTSKDFSIDGIAGEGGMGSRLKVTAQQIWLDVDRYQQGLRTNPNIGFISKHYPLELVQKIAEKAGKEIGELSAEDILQYLPIPYSNGLNKVSLFTHNLHSLFKGYQEKLKENRYCKFLNEHEGQKNVKYFTDEEFIKIYGEPPWDFFNKVVKEANLDYEVNSPTDTYLETPFYLKLINKLNGAEIQFRDLSSGEIILMSLALAIYNTTFDLSYNVDFEVNFPKLLLMDEPDASLHPSMTKQFLDVIQNILVKEKGIKVIMTTHSPSTVALAPEESLFIMNKNEPRVEKISKDRALKILTAGVPALSVHYENRRQVFVESENDVFFYDKFYEKLKDKLIPEISLNFISSGIGNSGNCSQVKEVVNKLASFGNKYIFGIIDWDSSNNGNEHVKVLGENKRYSIENYIFDPILIAAYLFREKYILRGDLNLFNNETYIDFKNLSQAQLQTVSDFITNKIQPLLNPTNRIKVRIKYVSGIEIEVPQWYLIHQGHDLENHFKKQFPQLNRFQREGELKKEIIKKVVDDIPEFISTDILELFESIQLG